MRARRDWHEEFFRNSFYNPASPAAVEKAPAEAAFILRRLKLKKGSALLDLCCGPGRHAVEFARRGLAVTGFDFSAEYLKEAALRARRLKAPLRLLRGDMRRLGFSGEFDAAVNLFTSFGYFLNFNDDLKTLKGVAKALKPGGLFLIELINGDYIRTHFAPRDWYDMGDHYLLESRTDDGDGLHNTWTKVPKRKGKVRERCFFNRLYGRARLGAALKQAGLRPLKFWGGYRGQPLSADAVRLICLAKKA